MLPHILRRSASQFIICLAMLKKLSTANVDMKDYGIIRGDKVLDKALKLIG